MDDVTVDPLSYQLRRWLEAIEAKVAWQLNETRAYERHARRRYVRWRQRRFS